MSFELDTARRQRLALEFGQVERRQTLHRAITQLSILSEDQNVSPEERDKLRLAAQVASEASV